MDTKEIIDEINSGKTVIFEKPIPSVRPNGLKSILTFIGKAKMREDIEQPYWIVTSRELYKNGELSESSIDKAHYPELERIINDLKKVIKERHGRILIKGKIAIIDGHLFLDFPGSDKLLDILYSNGLI